MGCDIHSFIEVKGKDGIWEMLPSSYSIDKEDDRVYRGKDDPFKLDRDYVMFGMLADVRNSYGMKVISEPRGIPVDASETYRRVIREWDGDYHSASFFYLRELKMLELDDYWRNTNKYLCIDETYKEIGYQLYNFIKKLTQYQEDNDLCHNCVRVVFFFDN